MGGRAGDTGLSGGWGELETPGTAKGGAGRETGALWGGRSPLSGRQMPHGVGEHSLLPQDPTPNVPDRKSTRLNSSHNA